MIDADQLERDLDAAPGEAVSFRKETIRSMIAELRNGQAARRSLVDMQGMITVSAATSGMRVPGGYQPPSASPTP